MTHSNIDYLVAREHQREILADAEYSRMVRAALSTDGPASTRQHFSFSKLALAFARGLSYLGERLLTWSCRLEGRYRALAGVEEPSPCG
jgi:hypothetical protein